MSAKIQEATLDRMLVDRFKSGDAAAFDEMVSRYWDRIYSMVNQLLRNAQDAEEVTQDAFIRAHRGLVNFRGDSAFSTWLYQIATNLARNRYWYWWRRKRDKSVSFDAPLGPDNNTTLAEIIPAEVETPDDLTVTQEFVDRVGRRHGELNAKHREILILRNVKNLSYEEIADILGICHRHRQKPHRPRPRQPARKNWRRLHMKDHRFTELLNLHLDHELTPAEAAELEAELSRDPARRRQYPRLPAACSTPAPSFLNASMPRLRPRFALERALSTPSARSPPRPPVAFSTIPWRPRLPVSPRWPACVALVLLRTVRYSDRFVPGSAGHSSRTPLAAPCCVAPLLM